MPFSKWRYWRRFHLPNLLYVLVLVGVALGSYWWVRSDSAEKSARVAPPIDRTAGVAKKAEFTQVNRNGRLQYHAVFDQAEYLANQDLRAQNIIVTTVAENQPKVVVTAKNAYWQAQNHRLMVNGEVELTREGTIDNPPLTLKTDSLQLDTEQGLAQTDSPFELTHGQSVLNGKHFRYDYQLRDLTMGKSADTGGRIYATLRNELKK